MIAPESPATTTEHRGAGAHVGHARIQLTRKAAWCLCPMFLVFAAMAVAIHVYIPDVVSEAAADLLVMFWTACTYVAGGLVGLISAPWFNFYVDVGAADHADASIAVDRGAGRFITLLGLTCIAMSTLGLLAYFHSPAFDETSPAMLFAGLFLVVYLSGATTAWLFAPIFRLYQPRPRATQDVDEQEMEALAIE